MAQITVPNTTQMYAVAVAAGSNKVPTYDGYNLIVPDVTQEALEQSFADYNEASVLVKQAAQNAIATLEAAITPRRIRDAFADPTWINAQEALIAIERAKL